LRHHRSTVGAFVTALGRSPACAVLSALLLALALVAPAFAASGSTNLRDADVSPTDGHPDTDITFSVTYRNAEGSGPDYVRVVVGGETYALHAADPGDEDWKHGVRYTRTMHLPVGTWPVRFESRGRNKFDSSLDAPTVTITPKPTPKPDPTPKPKPTPKPDPTPKPTPKPQPKPKPAPTARPEPRQRATPRPTAKPDAHPTQRPTVDPTAQPTDDPTAAPTESPSPTEDETLNPVIAGVILGGGGAGGAGGGGKPGGGASKPDGDGSGGPGPASDSVVTQPPSLVAILAAVAPTAVVTTGGVAMMMAFMVFGKRRRDGEPTAPDDVLAAQAARGSGVVPTSGMVGSTLMPGAAGAAIAVQAAIAPVPAFEDVDAHLPRWRRPSLMEARKVDPTRRISTNVRLSFDGDVGSAISGMERRLIRYRLVSLLSEPDEVRGQEIGVLDEGDEVVLLEKHGTYWRVLCPDGREGWLHKMTLGDTVIDSQSGGADSWTSGDGGPVGGFEDVLRAYQEHRQQFGDA
jgi:hypothetical protein